MKQPPWDGDETSPVGNRFGTALATGDLDRDGDLDLAIAAPFDGVSLESSTLRGDLAGPGHVYVVYGPKGGLARARLQVRSQRTRGVPGVSNQRERFGYGGLQILDVRRDKTADLLIHNPGDRSGRGTVTVLYGSSKGVTTRSGQLWHQDMTGIPGRGERGDGFGSAG